MSCLVYVECAPICTTDSRPGFVEATYQHILCETYDRILVSESVLDSLMSANRYR